MGTEKIREALLWLENYVEHEPEAQEARRAALREVDAFEQAAVDLHGLHVGDFVYSIRDREGLGWEGPNVKTWSDASSLMAAIARQKGSK